MTYRQRPMTARSARSWVRNYWATRMATAVQPAFSLDMPDDEREAVMAVWRSETDRCAYKVEPPRRRPK